MTLSVVRALVTFYETGQLLTRYAVVKGNLEIILKFMTQDNKVKKAELATMVQEMQELVKELRDIRVLL